MTTSLAKRADAPAWVRVGLYGVHSRSSARAFLGLSAAVGAIGIAAGVLVSPMYFAATALWLAVPWYARAIRWMDENQAWHDE
jgi:hypothetical protein